MKKLADWSVMQDVHDLGETLGLYREDFDFAQCAHLLSDFEPLPRLGALQVLLSDQPYYGRALRYFNQAPWWYRCQFDAGETAGCVALLRFLAVDYYCKVYLNGALVGEHEGYFEPFELDVTGLLREKDNRLFVKVWAPWDDQILTGGEAMRCFSVKRAMVKGTYEHADGFIQRDVNPVGILDDVELRLTPGAALLRGWNACVSYHDGDAAAQVRVTAKALGNFCGCRVAVRILDPMGVCAAEAECPIGGDGAIDLTLTLERPQLWNCWERGEPARYTVRLALVREGAALDTVEKQVGVRSVTLERTQERTRFSLNGRPIFLRGTSYFGDIYLSELSYDRYYRDLRLIRDAGFNAVRVHVHVEKDSFYDICDELGLFVIQDSDFNWDHPTDPAWMERAAAVFAAMVRIRRDHPSILCWVALNEPDLWKIFTHGLLEQTAQDEIMLNTLCVKLMNILKELDPERPYIRASREEDDPESGDSHTYTGSLTVGTAYTQIAGTTEKLNTEFGMDVPGDVRALTRDRRIWEALQSVAPDLEGLQAYQYRLLRYYTDHYRLQKYAPCSGYFQFMFIDLCPQSFYGILDFYGTPKRGYYAMLECGGPLALIAQRTQAGFRIVLVNDYLKTFQGTVAYTVLENGVCRARGEFQAEIGPDTRVDVGDAVWDFRPDSPAELRLAFTGADGAVLTKRHYSAAFLEFPAMAGQTMDNELGMRTYHFSAPVKERVRIC